MSVEVKPVSSRRERKLFLEYPWEVYRHVPQWVPPLRQNQKELVGFARNPFYEDAESQTFLAWEDGKVRGRIAAIVNHAHNRVHREQRGFFGFFECVDDEAVSRPLFDAVRRWLADRQITAIRGPANPSMNHECGLLIEGFDKPPTFMLPYNLPYYQRLVEGYGFRHAQDLYSFWGSISMMPQVADRLRFAIEMATERFQIQLRPLNTKNFRRDIELFLDVFNRSMEGMWGFVPMSAAEIRHMSKSLRWLIVPELCVVAEVEGQAIGALFCLPDYNPRIKQINGRLLPFGIFKLLSRKPFQRMRVISADVIPEYQMWGVGLVLLRGMVPKLLDSKIEEVEFSWVTESNKLSRGSLQKGGAMIDRVYRMYDYSPAAGPTTSSGS